MNLSKKLNNSTLFFISIVLFFWSLYFYTIKIIKSNFLWTIITAILTLTAIIIIILKNEDFVFKPDYFKINIKKIDLFIILSVLLFTFIINFKFLNSSIVFQGDEEGHISRAIRFFGRIKLLIINLKYFISFLILSLIALSSGLYFIINKHSKINKKILIITLISFSFFLFSIVISLIKKEPFIHFRYPPFVTFIHGLIISPIPLIRYSEICNRLIAFVPLLLTGIIIYLYLRRIKINILLSFFILITFSTLPVIMYYYSIVYLEQFMVFFLSIPIILLLYNFEKKEEIINKNIIALIIGLSGFVKDTVLPILIAMFLFLLLLELLEKNKKFLKKVINLTVYFILIFLPMVFYLILRIISGVRKHALDINNLFKIKLYSSFAIAIFEQLNIIIFLIIIFTIIYSIIKKKFLLENILAIFIIIFNFLFFAIDKINFAGYSRFNMGYIAAIIIYLILFAKILNNVKFKYKYFIYSIFFLLVITINLLLTPFTYEKRNAWGDPPKNRKSIGITYYPYNELCHWLLKNYNSQKCFYYNPSTSEYIISFYKDKYKLNIIDLNTKEYNIDLIYEKIKNEKNQLLIIHQSSKDSEPKIIINNHKGFTFIKSFCIVDNCIDVYLIN